MRNPLIPYLFLSLPALALGYRLGWLDNRWARRLAGAALLAGAWWWVPWYGVDLLVVKRVNLLIAAATALLLLLRHYRVPWTLERRRRLTLLAGLASLAALNYANYFALHGRPASGRQLVHLHDVAHYYLGAKYYAELGYRDLYTAMLRAEAERFDDHFKAIEARDLASYERVHIRTLLRRSEAVKAAFSPRRWNDFGDDVAYFRDRLGPLYGAVLLDHGFNPTPVWALLGAPLAARVPAGSERGIRLLAWLDPLLLAAALAAIVWAFGIETALLAAIHFCVVFGAGFGWTGGGFLRHPWFFATVVAFAALHRGYHRRAGALLALAAMLRLFPVFFLLPIAGAALAETLHRGIRVGAPTIAGNGASRSGLRPLLVSFAATAALLFALTAALPRGWEHWRDFGANLKLHVAVISPNVVGLTEALAWHRGAPEVTAEEFEALKVRRGRIRGRQLLLIFLPALVAAALLARRRGDLEAAALGLPLLYLGLGLAGYYYVFLVLLILVHRRSPGRLALIFAAEAAPYALQLFEDREALLFVYRGLLLLGLYATLELARGGRREAVSSSDHD